MSAVNNKVIIMDSDSFFDPLAIELLQKDLDRYHVVKPKIIYLNNGGIVSKFLSFYRYVVNDNENLAWTPGLAINRGKIIKECGYVFDTKIRWTEDSELTYRLNKYKVPVKYQKKAIVYHDPITLRHEIKCAFLYGAGKRLSIISTPERVAEEDFYNYAKSFRPLSSLARSIDSIRKNGFVYFLFSGLWRSCYLLGYASQKYLRIFRVG
jgi:GT2 family glycosyltransferase